MPRKTRKEKSKASYKSPRRAKSLTTKKSAQPSPPLTIPSERGYQRSPPSPVPPQKAPLAKSPITTLQLARRHKDVIPELKRAVIISGGLFLLLIVLSLVLH